MADARFPEVTLELKRDGGFPADASWELKILDDVERTRLTAGTDLERAEGLFLRFSIEVDGHACDLSGTEALFCCPKTGMDPSFLTEGYLSLYRKNENEWQKLAVRYTATDRMIQAEFRIDREGDLFFWKMPEEETETESETEAVTEMETESETESVTEPMTEPETETEVTTESETATESETEIWTESETETETETEAVTEPLTEPWTEAPNETETEATTESETMTDTERVTESETEAWTEPMTESETEPVTEPTTEPETESEVTTESETMTETERVTESETEIWTESEPETESETESVTEPMTEPWTEATEETETEGLTEPSDPEEESEAEFSYVGETSGDADGDMESITVRVPAGADIPENAVLRAERLEEGGEAYEEAVAAAREKLGISEGQDFYFLPYDIHLADGEGNELEPLEGSVSVTMKFSGDPFADVAENYAEVQRFAVHIKNDGTVEKLDIPETVDPQDGVYGFAVSSFSAMGPAMIGTIPKEDDPGSDPSDGPSADETYPVYEILYADGEMVFQNSPETEAGREVIGTYHDDGSKNENLAETDWDFYAVKGQITSVRFRDNVKMHSIQFIFKGCSKLEKVDVGPFTAAGAISIAQAFNGCSSLTSLDLHTWDVSSATNIGHLFQGCTNLSSLNIAGWNTSSAKNMYEVFAQCPALKEIDVSGWNTGKVTNMIGTFNGCSSLTELDLSNWNTGTATNMANLFNGCNSLRKLKLGSGFQFKTKDTALSGQWMRETTKEIYAATDLMNQYTAEMADTYLKVLPINFHGNGGTPTESTAQGCIGVALGTEAFASLETPTRSGFKFNGWWTDPDEGEGEQLEAETPLTQQDYYAHWTGYKVYEILYESGEMVIQSDPTPDPSKGVVYKRYEDDGSGTKDNATDWEFYESKDRIITVTFEEDVHLRTLKNIFNGYQNLSRVNGGSLKAPDNMERAFSNCTSLKTLDLNGWDTSGVTNIAYMFQGCTNLESLAIDKWDVSKVWILMDTFSGCASLTSLNPGSWNTSAVSNMIDTFSDCSSLTSLDLNSWDTSHVSGAQNMNGLFRNCSSLGRLTLGSRFTFYLEGSLNPGLTGNWQKEDSGKIYSSEQLMNNEGGAGTFVRLTVYEILYENGELVFQNSREPDPDKGSVLKIYEDDGSGAKGSAADWAFYEKRDKINTVTFEENVPLGSLAFAFSGYTNLTTVNGGTLTAPSSLRKAFDNCTSLTTANLGDWTTDKVYDMISMFWGCTKLETLDLSGWSTKTVADWGASWMLSMFYSCDALRKLSLGSGFRFINTSVGLTGYWQKEDDGKIYTSEQIMNNEAGAGTFVRPTVYEILYENGELVFQNSQQTDPAKGRVLKIYNDDGSGTKDSASDWAFYENKDKIVTVTFGEDVLLHTLRNIFNGYQNLSRVNGGSLKTPDNMDGAFSNCTSLTSLDLNSWDTSAAKDIRSMFLGCTNLVSLNISNWNVSSVWCFMDTFKQCTSLTSLDLGSWDTSAATNMINTFYDCSSLTSLDLKNWKTGNISGYGPQNMNGLFGNCSSLGRLTLGSGFKFYSSGGFNPGLTGSWKNKDTGEEYTAQALMEKYDGTAEQGTYNKFVRITFNGSGGVATPKSIDGYLDMTVETLPTATREGYRFVGWFTQPNGQGTQLTEGGQATELVYYACWVPYTYTLRLHAQNENQDTTDVKLTFNEFYQLSDKLFAPDDETTFLAGWNTRADGTGEMYDPNARVSGLADQDESTVHLYAIWGNLNDYVTLSFNTGGGSEIPSMRVKKGEYVGYGYFPVPTREDYTFEGWRVGTPEGDKWGGNYGGGSRPFNEDTTLYADWTPYVTVTFDPQIKGLQSETVRMPLERKLESLITYSPREDGRTLIGWFTLPSGGEQVYAGKAIYGDVTFYAHWGWRPEFDANGGIFVGESSLPFREEDPNYPIQSLPQVKQDGYTFRGWFLGDTEVHVGDTLDLTKVTQIVAKWDVIPSFEITLEPDGGKLNGKEDPVTLHAYKGKPLGNLPVPEREGYVFLGWHDGDDLCGPETIFTGTKALKAKWAVAVTVTFMDDTTEVKKLTVAKGGTIPSQPGAKKDNHILEGWYTDTSDERTKLTSETRIDGDVIYYAKWRSLNHSGSIGVADYTCGIEWSSASNENVDNVGDRLVFHPTDTKEQTAQLHVHFQVNAATQDSSIPAGAIKIKIPKKVWKDWDGNWTGTDNVGASLYEKSNDFFKISEEESEGDYYILTNHSPIPGGRGLDVTFSYSVDPRKVPGGGIDEAGNYVTGDGINCYRETFPVEITVDGDAAGDPSGNFKSDLSIEMHTEIHTSATKSVKEVYYAWQDEWGALPADASKYFYIEWALTENVEGTTNQPFTFTWSEENTVHDGTVVDIVGPVHVQPTGSHTYNEADKRVIMKYPRSMLKQGGVVPVHNEAIVTEKWDSGYQTSHRVSADVMVPYWTGGQELKHEKYAYDTKNEKHVNYPAQKAGGQEDILEEKEVTLGWKFGYIGGPDTQPTWNEETGTYTAVEHTISISDGTEGNLLYSSGGASDKYLWEPSTGNTVLSDDDYRLETVKVDVIEYDGERYPDGTWSVPLKHGNTGDYGSLDIYVRYKYSNDLVFFRRLERDQLRDSFYSEVSLPLDTRGIEIRYGTSFYSTSISVELTAKLKPSPAVFSMIRQDVAMDTTSLIKNFAHYKAWEGNPEQPYDDVTDLNKDGSAKNQVWELNVSSTKQFLSKSESTNEGLVNADAIHGVQDQPMCLTGWIYNTANRISQMKTGIFYDLLPMGTTVDPSTVYGIWTTNNWDNVGGPGKPANNYNTYKNHQNRLPDSLVDVSFVENWEGSRRTMMAIQFTMPDGVRANGIQMFYLLGNTYENIMANGTTQENDAAFVNTTEFSPTPTGTGTPLSELDAAEYFKSLDLQYSGTISYSEASTNYVPIDISTWGFDKEVKAEGATYSQKDTALLNNTYTWRLTYAQGPGTTTKDIVFYDVLENGFYEKTEGGGKKLVDSDWHGSFVGINVESLKKLKMKVETQDGQTEEKYLNPVVYYSTQPRESFADGMPDLENNEVWRTLCPEDPSTVTAIAVDCRKCEDDYTDFQLKGMKGKADAMQVFLTMRAPKDEDLVEKTARNRASLYMTHIDSEKQETSVMMDAGASVVLKDNAPELHKTSDPGPGTEDAPATVYQNEQLTYTLSVRNISSETVMNDIVVEDTIPAVLSVQNKDIKVRFGNDATATPVTTSPRVKLARNGQELTFTVNMLYPGETVYLEITGTVSVEFKKGADGKLEEVPFSNQAKIPSVNGVHRDFVSEEIWHKVIPAGFNISKIGVGGRPLAGAVLQLYKKKEGAEPGAGLNDPDAYETKDEWKWNSDGTTKTFEGMDAGTYIIHEESAPAGHLVTDDITVEFDGKGGLKMNGKSVPEVTVKDDYTKVRFTKYYVDPETGRHVNLAGAKMEVYRQDDFVYEDGADGASKPVKPMEGKTPVAKWTTTDQPYLLEGVLEYGNTYVLYEAEAPEGYQKAAPAKFGPIETLSSDGIYEWGMEDKLASFEIKARKEDPDGNPLARARLRITGTRHDTGAEIDAIVWDTTVDDHTVRLYPGSYTLTEVFAPDGYALGDPIHFTVEEGPKANTAILKVNGEPVEDLTLVMIDKLAQDLEVKKTVQSESGDPSKEKEYNFTLKLSRKDGTPFTSVFAYEIRDSSGKITESGVISQSGTNKTANAKARLRELLEIAALSAGRPQTRASALAADDTETGTEGTYRFQLKAGERITIKDVPQDLLYEVTEDTEKDAGYVSAVTNGSGTTKGKESTKVTVTNTYLAKGHLVVTKTVVGSWAPKDAAYTIEITPNEGNIFVEGESKDNVKVYQMLPNGESTKEMPEGTVTIEDRRITVKLKGGERIVIKGLAPGTYTVKETAPSEEDGVAYSAEYKVNGASQGAGSASASVEIGSEQAGSVEVQNIYPDQGELTVEKKVAGGTAPGDGEEAWYDVQISSTAPGAFENCKLNGSPISAGDAPAEQPAGGGAEAESRNMEPSRSLREVAGEEAEAAQFRNAKVERGILRFQIRAGGSVTITGLPVGTYTVTEEVPGEEAAFTTTYQVGEGAEGDNSSGVVTLGGVNKTGKVTILNTYPDPASTTFEPKVEKTVEGNPPTNGTFTFTLTAQDNAPMPEKAEQMLPGDTPTAPEDTQAPPEDGTLAATGTAIVTVTGSGSDSFGKITYDKAGVYTYTIKETKGDTKGYTYDESVWTLTVTVTVEGGKLKATGSYSREGGEGGENNASAAAFKNTYKPVSTTFTPKINKTVEGTPKTPETFTFTLTAQDGIPMPEGSEQVTVENGTATTTITVNSPESNKGSGSFGKITYDKAGEYTYTIKEANDDEPGYAYDKSVWTLTVTVTDEGGELKATGSYSKDGSEGGGDDGSNTESAAFTNAYQPVSMTLTGTKAVAGKTPEGESYPLEAGKYHFLIEAVQPSPEDGAEMTVKETTAGEYGMINFGEITFKSAGTYRFKVSETSSDDPKVKTDGTVYTVSATVKENDKGVYEITRVEIRRITAGTDGDGPGEIAAVYAKPPAGEETGSPGLGEEDVKPIPEDNAFELPKQRYGEDGEPVAASFINHVKLALELPDTGGPGTAALTALSVLLCLVGCSFILLGRKGRIPAPPQASGGGLPRGKEGSRSRHGRFRNNGAAGRRG